MKIIYIVNARIPTEKAHGYQIMKTCEALAEKGDSVLLVIPSRDNSITDDPYAYYGVKKIFEIRTLPSIKFSRLFGDRGLILESIQFGIMAALFAFRKDMTLYSRDAWPTFLISCIRSHSKPGVYIEVHDGRNNWLWKTAVKRSRGVVSISRGLREFYKQFRKTGIEVVPDGVDLSKFKALSKSEARTILSLPQDKKIIVYSGHLYSWKGTDILAQSAPLLNKNCLIVFLGGTEKDVIEFRNKYGLSDNILILGSRPSSSVPSYLFAADLLVIPNSAKARISRDFTSPLKLFEYMASGRPIVASDLPSIREVLDTESAILVAPDDPAALAEAINKNIANTGLLESLALKSQAKAREYSWEKRAEKIRAFLARNDGTHV